jgi:hypothetical protein
MEWSQVLLCPMGRRQERSQVLLLYPTGRRQERLQVLLLYRPGDWWQVH